MEELLGRYDKAIGMRAKAVREQWLIKIWMEGNVASVKEIMEHILRL